MRTISRPTAIFLTLALAACSGGGGTGLGSSVPDPAQPPVAAQAGSTGAIAYGAETLKGAAYRGASQLKNVDIGILVKLRDATGLMAYAKAVGDPRSGLYRQFLTPAEIADRFGATAKDYAAVAKYFQGRGLAVMGWKQRELLRISGPQKAMESALGARFGEYTKNGRVFHSLTAAPNALAALPISALLGASSYARLTQKPFKVHSSATAGSGYSAQQIAAAFDFSGAYSLGYTGAGINVGIIGTGPIDQADLAAYKSIYHVVGTSTLTQVNVTNAGGNASFLPTLTFAPPPATTDSCTLPATGPDATCNPEDVEAQIDTEQVATLARNANVLFYLAYAPNYDGAGSNAEGLYGGIQPVAYEIQQAISDNRADALSLSYGVGERDDVGGDFVLGSDGFVNPAASTGPIEFATLASMGVAVFVSSGDNGATNCGPDGVPATQNDLCVTYPATDQNVVAVGGVNTPLANNGRIVGPLTGWGTQTSGGAGGSGGGVSVYFPAPAYQQGVSGIAGATRNTPDISLEGDSLTGVAVVYNARFADGGIAAYGGTSVSAPEAAAMWALVLQTCKQNPAGCHPSAGSGGVAYRLGNPNSSFYAIYASAAQYGSTFFDVLFGSNSQLPPCAQQTPPTCPQPVPTLIPGYSAGKGYDRITGIGVPFARPLIKTITGV